MFQFQSGTIKAAATIDVSLVVKWFQFQSGTIKAVGSIPAGNTEG